MKRLLVLALCLLTLVACGRPVTSGTVISKTYTPARDWQESVPDYIWVPVIRTSCSTVNNKTTCSNYTDMQMRLVGFHNEPRHADQFWEVRLRNKDGDEGDVKVDQTTYDRLEIGSQYGKEPT